MAVICLATPRTFAQSGREVSGTVLDSTKLSVPGASVKLTSDKGDSTVVAANVDGKFTFPSVKGTKLNITISSIGYQTLLKHFTLDADTKPANVGTIVLQMQSNQLAGVSVVGVTPVTVKEDTVEYKVSAFPVRANAPIEDVLKKLPGVDVDKDGNVSAEGKSVTKVRVNGKDYFGGDVLSATKNLPADIIDNIQIVDDYGDQANLTGIKTGEPNKILNINIRKDKNYGYTLQATAGDGSDALPSNPGVSNDNRHIGLVNYYRFNGDQQVSIMGNLNNTNVNTFNFTSASGGSGVGGGGGNRGGGGGGRGNALQGSGQTTGANGITNSKSIGLNFRDEWGKKVSVYGSYSFNDNSTFTNSTSLQINKFVNPSTSNSTSNQDRGVINHRFNFNIEYRLDSMNYFKFVPSFSYSKNDVNSIDDVLSTRGDSTNLAYNVNSVTNSTSPNFGLNALYNHKFNSRGRNFSVNMSFNSTKNTQFDNPIYNYTAGVPTSPLNQRINTNSRTTTYGTNLSYMEPLSKVSFLELNYAFNHSYTTSDKRTDTLDITSGLQDNFNQYALLSNNYNYTFTTNLFGANYRLIESKYNLTLGVGGQPTVLDGQSITNNTNTRVTGFNFVPTARFTYNFSRAKSLSFNYNGSADQPQFNELQPVVDLSNALYPVQGNPNLDASFSNRLNLRYRNASFDTGNVFFSNLSFTQTNDKVVTSTITYPVRFSQSVLSANPSLKNFQNTNLTTYTNADGYYQASAFGLFSKPWAQRKYTLIINGNVSYTNNIGFSGSIDSNNVSSAIAKNISKSLIVSPGIRFRTNFTDIVDAEVNTSYSINKTTNSLNSNPLFNQNTNVRTLNLGVNGKNYFWKDWTLSYDFTRSLNYGYSVPIKNPNILNVYVERRFLKNNMATVRVQGFDLFNQNTGFSSTDVGNITTQTNVNKLGRYFLLTFSLRLQKFAGKAPSDEPRDFRGGRGDRGPGGGGPGGPGAM
ncbi:carboxypeptidase-like regulatory domain-containing protein [Mucilaginibacter gynuensis]|uniref:Carboxypeptidase-like regulatory domain-containing protein n=1 Tax=Mucilaginibacter gynuensis TaxID=1302236 RepID=A0ABP8HCU6_9SPHI